MLRSGGPSVPRGSDGAAVVSASGEPTRAGLAPSVDLEALARCVYDLLRREARLERERLGIRR